MKLLESLQWLPPSLVFLLMIFLSLFAFDVFIPGAAANAVTTVMVVLYVICAGLSIFVSNFYLDWLKAGHIP